VKLTTKSRYGMNAMYELTRNYGGEPLPLKVIAERQGIPEAFLEQLMKSLRSKELVTATRGAQGGYALARNPQEIMVGDVLVALEGQIAPVDCLLDAETPCQNGGCAGRVLWKKIYEAICQLVDHMSLAELAEEYEAQ